MDITTLSDEELVEATKATLDTYNIGLRSNEQSAEMLSKIYAQLQDMRAEARRRVNG